MTRKLYGDAKLIEELLPSMQLMEEAAGGWAAVYKDTASGAFWMKCYTTAGEQGGGYELLIKLPLPTTEELISIAVSSPFEDESVAAVLRLLDEENAEKKNFRLSLIQRLEEQGLTGRSAEQKQRVQQIITLAALHDPMNRREVLGKSAEEVRADATYFEEASERARQLLRRL